MTLAQRLIARRIALTALGVCAVLLLILASTQILNHATRIIDASGGWRIVVQLIALALPGVTASMLPLAWLVGLMQAYDSMRASSETVVLMGAGHGHGYLLRPAIVLSVLISVLTLLLSLFVEPAANRQMRDVTTALIQQAQTVVIGDGVLRELQAGVFLRAGPVDEAGALQGFLVLDRREAGIESLLIAESLRLVTGAQGENLLEMVNGQLLVRDLETGLAHTASFGSFRAAPDFFVNEYRASPRARETPSAVLLADLRAGTADTERWRELLRRLTDWLYPLAFCAIAAWLTIRADLHGQSARQRHSRLTMVQAIALGAALKVAGMTVPQLASAPLAAMAAGVLVPVVGGLAFAALALAESQRARAPASADPAASVAP